MRVRTTVCDVCEVTLEGDIEVSPLGRLSMEDQLFVTAFVRSHGSIKRMEALFDISYPTVKNRLNAISRQLDAGFVPPEDDHSQILDQLASGEITVEQALEALE